LSFGHLAMAIASDLATVGAAGGDGRDQLVPNNSPDHLH
jgi:hypothetical protein